MCLMCEWYVDYCEEPECYESADAYNRYTGRTGLKLFLWRGDAAPCKHIIAKHAPKCTVFDEKERYCNCIKTEDGWTYE